MARTSQPTKPTLRVIIKMESVQVMGPTGKLTMKYRLVVDESKPIGDTDLVLSALTEALKFFRDEESKHLQLIHGKPTNKEIVKQAISSLEKVKRDAQDIIDQAWEEYLKAA
jgi:hypothetical protein